MKTILIVGNEIATQALSRDVSLMSVFGSIHESMKPKSAFLTCFSAWMVIFFKILWSGLFACIGWFLLPANQTSWLVLKGNFGRKQIAIFQASVSDGRNFSTKSYSLSGDDDGPATRRLHGARRPFFHVYSNIELSATGNFSSGWPINAAITIFLETKFHRLRFSPTNILEFGEL